MPVNADKKLLFEKSEAKSSAVTKKIKHDTTVMKKKT